MKRILLLLIFLSLGFVVFSQNALTTMPEFPGGPRVLSQFIYTHMHYPDKAQMLGITGLVQVQFTVLPTGKISNAHLLHDIGGGCGTEAMRLVSVMPPWKPGSINNEPASITVTLPIMFDLRERKINQKKMSRKERRQLRKLKQ